MTNKVTKREMFEAIKAVLTDEAQIAFIDHELELLAKKNAYKSDKPTAAQVANEGIKTQIMEVLTAEPNRLFTATEVGKAVNPDLSNQRISALLRQLVEDGKVTKTVDKRKSYFQLA